MQVKQTVDDWHVEHVDGQIMQDFARIIDALIGEYVILG
jgi:hypothetical protein